jgi:predicted RNase H-like HicB family nuclease
MNEIVFQVTQEADGGFVAEALCEDIFTQGDTWDELRVNVKEAVNGHFFDRPKPAAIRLHQGATKSSVQCPDRSAYDSEAGRWL